MFGYVKNISAAFMLLTVAGIPICAEGREFRLGIISEKPVERKITIYDPLASYVAERLKPVGVTGAKVVVAGDIEEMLVKIRNKEVDVVLESPFSAIQMIDKAAMQPKLLVWKRGIREYNTVFFVRKGSPITKLTDLKGKVLALQDPGSTSAFLIPIAELKQLGLKVVSSKSKAPASAVKYQLAAHEKNQVFWVLQKKADAAAFGSDDWDHIPELQKRDLQVIHTTKPVLRYLALFHPDLPPELSEAIFTVLVQMNRDPQGELALKEASKTTKMEPLTAKDHQSLKEVRRLMQRR
jgi:phosphonate transport system substrate-binding protein